MEGTMLGQRQVRRRTRRVAAIALGLAALIIATTGASAAATGQGQPSYTYVEIGVLGVNPAGEASSQGLDVNNSRQAIGHSTVSESGCAFHSFVTTDGSSLTDLGVFTPPRRERPRRGRPQPSDICRSTFATAISEAGDIVGYAHTSTAFEPPHAFLYRDGRLTDLGTGFGAGSVSTAYDVNDAGLIVGSRRPTQSDPERAVVWLNGVLTPLPGLGGIGPSFDIQDRAEAVNGLGDVVGEARATDGTLHAALWRNGQIQDLAAEFPGALATFARDVNDAGQVLIDYRGSSVRAKVWQNGTVRDIGGFFPSGINNAGKAVGTSVVSGAGGASFLHAVVSLHGSDVLDLNQAVTNLPSGVTLGHAEEINDNGVIVGWSCTNQCQVANKAAFRGFLLIPNS
jgi:probable HAF family extracellular repeat protein